jgi:oxalate decarboxylase/phosphoglucose isomerase-like protein (cupin superfamily)
VYARKLCTYIKDMSILLSNEAAVQAHRRTRVYAGELLFGLVEENNGRVITTILKQGTSISIPQGLMHFAQNLGCEAAQFLANFPNRDPGTQTTIANFLRLPPSVIRGTLNVDDATIQALRVGDVSMDNPSIDPVCAKQCGLAGY